MGKKWLAFWMTMVLVISCGTALAVTTGIAVDGRVYSITGGVTQFESDGKTFVIGEKSVTVKEPGQPDLVLPLHTECDDRVDAPPRVTIVSHAMNAFMEEEAESVCAIEPECVTVQAIAGEFQEVTFVGLSDAQAFRAYEKYGLSYDANNQKLYYHGVPVRVFTDEYEVDEFLFTIRDYFDETGSVDVVTVRDMTKTTSLQPAGELTGLRKLSDEEFAQRDLSHLIWKEQIACCAGGENGMTNAEKKRTYAEYEPLGLVYNAQTDTLLYQEMAVRSFLDIRTTNGEPMMSGRFRGVLTMSSWETGSLRVETIRDYDSLNENGEGKLIGLTCMLTGE